MHLFVRFLGLDLVDLVFGTDEPQPQAVNISGPPISERVLEDCECDECDGDEETRHAGFGF